MKTLIDIFKRKEEKDFKEFIDKEEKKGRFDDSFAKVREEIKNLKETD